MSTTNSNVRADSSLKQESEELFNDPGLNMSSAITMFLKSAVSHDGIPLWIGLLLLILVILEQTNVISFGRFTLNPYAPTTTAQIDSYENLIVSLCFLGYFFIIVSLVI